MTHQDLVFIGSKFVKTRFRYPLIYSEIACVVSTGEIPDIIAFAAFNKSILIECKISRTDFLRDKKKRFRINALLGMGKYRFYLAPKGLIKMNELPESWGLIEVDDCKNVEITYHPYCKSLTGNIWSNGFDQNIEAERAFLFSVLRRIQ